MRPDNILHRVDWSKVFPPLAEKTKELVHRCRARGLDYWPIEGFRDPDRQQVLWNQGRVTPGDIVTNARPWQSYHNYGLAIDFALDSDTSRKGLQPDWRIEQYQVLAEEAKELGLDAAWYWTGKFREGSHVQWPVKTKGISLPLLKSWYLSGGLEEVWLRVLSKGPW